MWSDPHEGLGWVPCKEEGFVHLGVREAGEDVGYGGGFLAEQWLLWGVKGGVCQVAGCPEVGSVGAIECE